MAKLLTKAKHSSCLTSTTEQQQQQQQAYSNHNSSSQLLSLSKKKRYTNVPITSSHNHHNRTSTNTAIINKKQNNGRNMCLVCSKSKVDPSLSSSLNSSLHSLSSTASTITAPLNKDDLGEGLSRSPSATSTSSTNSTCSSSGSSSSPSSSSSYTTASAGARQPSLHDVVVDTGMSTTTRRGILSTPTSRSSKKKKRVCFAPPLPAGNAQACTQACTDVEDNSNSPCNISLVSPKSSSSSSSYSVQTTVIEYIQPSSTMTDTQRSDAYWQIQDYEYFRGTAQIIANEVLKVTATQPPTSHSYNAVMTRVYDLCAVLSERDHQKQQQQRQKDQCRKDRKGEDESIAALDTTVPASCSSLSSTSSSNPSSPPSSSSDSEMMIPPHLFAALTHWIKAGHSRRGLERFCTSHVRTRPMAKAATIQAVLLAQDLLHKLEEERKQQQQKTSQSSPTKFQIGSNEFPLGSLSKEEVLRLVSERFSNTSRYFGTAMGHADAAAIGNYQHPLKN